MRRARPGLLTLVWVLAFSSPAIAQFRFYSTPGVDPGGLAVGPDGNVWFAAEDRIGRLAPGDGSVTYAPLTMSSARDVVVGPDGNIWYAGGFAGRVALDGTPTELIIPGLGQVWSLTAGPDALWIGDYGDGAIWRLDPTGAATEHPVPGHMPWRLAFGADGQIWFGDFARPFLYSMTTAGALTTHQVLNDSVQGVAAGPDGNVWFSRSHSVGYVTPAGAITTFPVADPKNYTDLVAGTDGNLWVVGDDTFVCIPEGCQLPPEHDGLLRVSTSGAQTFFPFPGGRVISDVARIAAGPGGSLWVSAYGGIMRFEISLAGQLQTIPTLDGVGLGALVVGLAAVGWLALSRRVAG